MPPNWFKLIVAIHDDQCIAIAAVHSTSTGYASIPLTAAEQTFESMAKLNKTGKAMAKIEFCRTQNP
jgi:hypothetical protein